MENYIWWGCEVDTYYTKLRFALFYDILLHMDTEIICVVAMNANSIPCCILHLSNPTFITGLYA